MIACEVTSCRSNSECHELHPDTNTSVCRADYILIRDKGFGPQCRSFDELKECFGKIDMNDYNCIICEDRGCCSDFKIEKEKSKKCTVCDISECSTKNDSTECLKESS